MGKWGKIELYKKKRENPLLFSLDAYIVMMDCLRKTLRRSRETGIGNYFILLASYKDAKRIPCK